jgi:hypothetical protein
MQKIVRMMLIKRMGFALIVAYALTLLLLLMFGEAPNVWSAALWGVALYAVATIFALAVNTGAWLLDLFFNEGEDMKDLILENLRKSKLPPPSRYQPKTLDYLQELADDADIEPDTRVKAGALYSTITTVGSTAGLFGSYAWHRAAHGAVLRYALEAALEQKGYVARHNNDGSAAENVRSDLALLPSIADHK